MEARPPAGVYAALLAGLFAISSSAILIAYTRGAVPALSVAFWRTACGALLLAPVALTRSRSEIRALTARDWTLIGGAALLLAAHFVLWIGSLYFTTVASATVLVTTTPIFLAIFGFVMLGERFRWPLYAATVVGIAGAAFVALAEPPGEAPRAVTGNLMALAAALCMTFYLLVGRVVRLRLGFLAYVFPLYALIALFTGLAAVASGAPLLGLPPRIYGLCLLMALGPQLVGHGSFNYALRYVPATLIGLLSLVEPVGASVAAYFLFGSRPTLLAGIAMLVTLAAVGLAVWFEGRSPKGGRKGIRRQVAKVAEAAPEIVEHDAAAVRRKNG